MLTAIYNNKVNIYIDTQQDDFIQIAKDNIKDGRRHTLMKKGMKERRKKKGIMKAHTKSKSLVNSALIFHPTLTLILLMWRIW